MNATHAPTERRTMIVTGASSGIGAALAQVAAACGYAVLLVARRADRLAAVATAIRAAGGVCETVAADVTASDAPQRIVEAAMRAFGRIDVIVNNAGVGAPGTLLEQSEAATDAQWQLHVAGPLRLARLALAQMRDKRGGFVFLGSGLARVPLPGYGAYCAAKGAVRAAAIQLRRELRAGGVFVTYVDPGVVATEFSEASGTQRAPAAIMADPKHVAARILRGIEHRAARVNGVPWQTALVVLAEWFPALGDSMANRTPNRRAAAPQPTAGPAPLPEAVPPPETKTELRGFDAALEPVARRMERVKLSPAFVRELLVPGTTIDLHEVAMRWAGMPNKNERAVMAEVLDALAGSQYLRPDGAERWSVLRAAD